MRGIRAGLCLFAVAAGVMTAGAVVAAPAQAAPKVIRVWTAEPSQTSLISARQTWAGCGLFDSNTKVVRAFTRNSATATDGHFLRGSTSNLACGSEVWGYRHILKNHRTQWEDKAFYTKQNWRDLADFAIAWDLTDPDLVKYRSSNDTFGFQRLIYLVNKSTGQTVGTATTCTVVARVTKNIITAFPGRCP